MSKKVLGGRFQLEGKLGEGGMGSVYRALDLQSRRSVAIKILRKDLSESRHARRRFAREARAAGMLDHPNIVGVLKFYDEARPYMVMELVDGVSMRRFVRREKPSVDRLLAVMMQLCDALAHAHDNGIVHRDIKPDNIVITQTPQGGDLVKVLDFGLARVRLPEISHLTRSGSALGTCSYMAPEQASGRPADERSDLYSLGVILYEAVCGRTPFTADDPASILYMHVHEVPRSPRTHNPDIHPELERLILRLMSKQADQRPSNARLLKEQLQTLRKVLRGELSTMDAPTVRTQGGVGLPQALPKAPAAALEPAPGEAVSVLTADVPAFGLLTRGRNPLEATELEAELVENLEESVRQHDGRVLDRYGTRVVAAFCGEDHGSRAVHSVAHMRSRVGAVLNRYALEVVPTVSAGVFGGELPQRKSGDSWEEVAKQELMHGAARLERLSRKLPDDTLVSEDCLAENLRAEHLRSLFVRGRREPIKVFRVQPA
jgi:class 3 adenylate cyclase/predicted Ser/Thr protein kinase